MYEMVASIITLFSITLKRAVPYRRRLQRDVSPRLVRLVYGMSKILPYRYKYTK